MGKLTGNQPSRLLTCAWRLAALLLALYLGEIFLIRDDYIRLVVTDITSPVINLFVTAALFLAAKYARGSSKRLERAWGVLAVAQLSYSLGDIIWAVLEAGLGQSAFPSFADGFYLAYYLLFFAGILLFPARRFSIREWAKRALETGIIVVASFLVFWNFIIGPLSTRGVQDPFLTQALSLAYPTGDLLLLFALLMLLYHRSDEPDPRSLLLLAASVAIQILTDSIFSIQSLAGTYTSGGIVDIGWTIGYLLAGMAGICQAASAQQRCESPRRFLGWLQSSVLLAMITAFLPYIWLICAFALLVVSHATPLPLSFFQIAIGVGVIIGFVLSRQAIILFENRQLVAELHGALERVQQQAREMEQTNRVLTAEIAERRRIEERLAHDALHDGLTGLPNRALFFDRLKHSIAYSRRRPEFSSAVLFLDLDNFKVINDSLGHLVGDQLLITTGQRLRKFLRAGDTVARLGGDEFGILLEDAGSEENVIQTTRRIQAILRLPVDNIAGQEVFTTASIGVVANVGDYSTPEQVFQDADIALYRAKVLGRERYNLFTPDLRLQAISRLQLENELRRALENEEFQLRYQPIFALTACADTSAPADNADTAIGAEPLDDLQTVKIVGFEALLRWNHPNRGQLAPAEFLDVAEETGQIIAISKWVLCQACDQLSRWNRTFPEWPDLTVHVNVSSKQFSQPDFVEYVEQTLRDTGISASALRLEITERLVIDNHGLANEIFARLNSLGIQLEVDDFGTGYSSLSYLQHFPIRTVKIDRSFIEEMNKPGKNADLVRTMIQMASSLGMDTIAEGIETREQLSILKDLSCPYGQGYLLSKPLDVTSVEKLLYDSRVKQEVSF